MESLEQPDRTLITGGAGFVGSHLVDVLVALGRRVTVLDDFSTGREENLAAAMRSGAVEVIDGSVLDAELVERCIRSSDACVHLACVVGVKLILADPLAALLANVRGTDVVLAAAARNRRRLLYTSSSEVYGKLSSGSLAESSDLRTGSPTHLRWSYSIAKQFGEAVANAYDQAGGTEMLVVRLFNTVGPRQSAAYGMVLPRFVRQALAGEPLTVYGDGTQARCFTSVHDVTSALVALLDRHATRGTYNIGSSQPVRILDLARRVIERTGSSSPIRFVPYADAYGRGFEELGYRVPDTSQLRTATGWVPEHDIDETIEEVISDTRSHHPPQLVSLG